MVPVTIAATITIQYWACPVEVSAKSVNGGTTKADCVHRSTVRFR